MAVVYSLLDTFFYWVFVFSADQETEDHGYFSAGHNRNHRNKAKSTGRHRKSKETVSSRLEDEKGENLTKKGK
jgi:hypothetical protein